MPPLERGLPLIPGAQIGIVLPARLDADGERTMGKAR
jgi:hypothetical protein